MTRSQDATYYARRHSFVHTIYSPHLHIICCPRVKRNTHDIHLCGPPLWYNCFECGQSCVLFVKIIWNLLTNNVKYGISMFRRRARLYANFSWKWAYTPWIYGNPVIRFQFLKIYFYFVQLFIYIYVYICFMRSIYL